MAEIMNGAKSFVSRYVYIPRVGGYNIDKVQVKLPIQRGNSSNIRGEEPSLKPQILQGILKEGTLKGRVRTFPPSLTS